jgi:hypothetical protein
MVKALKIIWAGYVARKGLMRHAYATLIGKSGGRYFVGFGGISGRIILKIILKE